MKQLRFTTSKPGFMGTASIPLVVPESVEQIIQTDTKYKSAYIHGDAEELAGYDIPIFLDGDLGQLDLPIEEQDILMLLIGEEYKCKCEVGKDGLSGNAQYWITLKR